MSSTTARASRKTRRRPGTRGPIRASAPTRNAVSVEITIPHACSWPEPAAIRRKSAAGTASPATAATTGTMARDQLVSSPIANSRRTSSPTVKKKIAMSASLTSACRVKSSCRSATPTVRWVSQNVSYESPDTFAQMIATRVASSRRRAPMRFWPIARIVSAIERRERALAHRPAPDRARSG